MAKKFEIMTRRYHKRPFNPNKNIIAREVLHKKYRTWRLKCRRMKQIRSKEEYKKIVKPNHWALARVPNNITVQYSKRRRGPDKPSAIALLWANCWLSLDQLRNSPYKAFRFFKSPPRRRRPGRRTIREWTPRQSLRDFPFDKILEGKFVHVSKGVFKEFYKVQWPLMRIKPKHFHHLYSVYQRISRVFSDALEQYIQADGKLEKHEERFRLAPVDGNVNIEQARPSNALPPPERQLDPEEMEEPDDEPVDQVEADQNQERANQLELGIVEFMDIDDDEPGELVIDIDQEEEEDEQQQQQLQPLHFEIVDLAIEPAREYDPDPMADFVPVNQAIPGHGQIEQQLDRQVDQFAALHVPVIAPERQGLGHLRRERGRGRQRQQLILRRIAEQRHRQRARRVRLAVEFVPIEAPLAQAADDQHAELAGHDIDLPNGQFGLENIEEHVQEPVIGDRQPLVNVVPEIEPQLGQMELHNAEDIVPRAEIEHGQPLVNAAPEIVPPLNQMELHNAEDIVPRAEIEHGQPLVNVLPEIEPQLGQMELHNAEDIVPRVEIEHGQLLVNAAPEIVPPLNQMELHNAEDIVPRAEMEHGQPLVNVLPEIEPQLGQMELHNAEDIVPRVEIEHGQPLVNAAPEIEPQLGQMELHNAEDIVPRVEIEHGQPLVNVVPEIEPPLNQMELHNAEDIVPRAEIEHGQPLVNAAPEIEPPLNQMELHNAEDIVPRAEIEHGQPLVNAAPEIEPPLNQMELHNAEDIVPRAEIEHGQPLVNVLPEIEPPLNQMELGLEMGQEPPPMAHQPFAPVIPVIEPEQLEQPIGPQIDQQAGQEPPLVAPEPMDDVNQVNLPQQNELALEHQMVQPAAQLNNPIDDDESEEEIVQPQIDAYIGLLHRDPLDPGTIQVVAYFFNSRSPPSQRNLNRIFNARY